MILEHKFVLVLSKKNIAFDEYSFLIRNINSVDWYKVYLSSLHHRTVNNIYNSIKKLNIESYLSKNVLHLFEKYNQITLLRNTIIYEEMSRISNDANEKKIPIIFIKGSILGSLIYNDISIREIGDIDILVQEKHLGSFSDILKENGYTQGYYDKQNKCIKAASRFELIQHRINTHELIEFLKIPNNCNKKYCEIFSFDVNFDIFWKGSCNEYEVDLSDFFENSKNTRHIGQEFRALDLEYNIIQLCAHFYSEAVYFPFKKGWESRQNELILMRVIDIYELLLLKPCLDKIKSICIKKKIIIPIFYTLNIINIIYPNCIDEQFLKSVDIDLNIINFFVDTDNKTYEWNLSILERLFELEKKKEDYEKIKNENKGYIN